MHNTRNFNDVKPRLRVGSAIQEPSPHMCETVAASAARIHELLPAQDESEYKLPRENRTMTKETRCAIRESSFLLRRTRLFPHKTPGLYPKSVASSSKSSAFPPTNPTFPREFRRFLGGETCQFQMSQTGGVRIPLL